MNPHLIEVHNIKKSYQLGDQVFHALDGITLTINQGDFVAIMGPSGSGKSTLAHILGLLDNPSKGSYKLNGQETSHLSEDVVADIRREKIGFIFQQFNLLPRTSAKDNVLIPAFYSKRKNGESVALELLGKVGLQDRVDHHPNQLSGGQQQRVAIARSLINGPKIILADEPTGNLDSTSESEILNLLQELNRQGITILMVTHEEEVATLASRLIRLRDGKIESDERLRPITSTFVDDSNEKFDHVYIIKELLEHFYQGIKILWSNKVRTFLSILGILIGVAAVVSMMAIGRGAQDEIQEQLSRLGTNLLVLRTGSRRGSSGVMQEIGGTARLTPSDAVFLQQAIPSISRISPSVRSFSQIVYENKNWNTSVEGVWPDYEFMRNATPIIGRFFTSEEDQSRQRVAVIGDTVYRELFGEEDPIGQMIKINRVNFQVIGVLGNRGEGGWRDPGDNIFIPLNTAMRRLFGEEYVDRIEIEVSDFSLMEEVSQVIPEMLVARKRIPDAFSDGAYRIRNLAEIQEAATESNRTMSFLLASIAGISLLVGGIGIMNIMLVSVTERTKEVGLRKAIGAKRKDILFQFLVESVLVSLSGGVIGVVVGCLSAVGISYFWGWTTSISMNSIILAFSFSVIIGIVFGIYPAQKAAKLQPIKALRYE